MVRYGNNSSEGPYLTVSIAMCTYNGEAFLRAQLNSILAQTVMPDEMVVQDDGSTDATAAMIAAFAIRAPFPVHFTINPVQLRPAQNFAACISRCAKQIVILTDQDDLWMPDRIERTIAAHRDGSVTFTFSDALLIDRNDTPLGRSIFDTVPISGTDRARLMQGVNLLPLILRYGVLYGTTMSIRQDLADAALPIPQGWSHDEWLSLIGAAVGRSQRLEPVTHYRQHEAQVVGAGPTRLKTIIIGARDRAYGFYAADRDRYRAARDAITRSPNLTRALAPALDAKLAFLEARRLAHLKGLAGIAPILRHASKGHYAAFAGGARSMVKDLMLALRTPFGRDR